MTNIVDFPVVKKDNRKLLIDALDNYIDSLLVYAETLADPDESEDMIELTMDLTILHLQGYSSVFPLIEERIQQMREDYDL